MICDMCAAIMAILLCLTSAAEKLRVSQRDQK